MSIEVSKLCFSYRKHKILEDISFMAEDNQLLSILGPNGAGKSTMFHCILGLLSGYKGKVCIPKCIIS